MGFTLPLLVLIICVLILSIGDDSRPVRKRFIPAKLRDDEQKNVPRKKKKKLTSSPTYASRSSKAYRERIKAEDPERWQQMLDKKKQYCKERVANFTDEQKARHRELQKIRKRKKRA